MGQVAGFKKIHVGVFEQGEDKIKKKMVWEDENGGTVNLNISGLAPEMVDMWASNKRVWMKKQGTNEVQSELDLFNVPDDDLDTVLGRDKDDNGSSWIGDDTRAPYVAMIGESEDVLTGDPVYCALVKGTLSLDAIEWKTKEQEEEAPEPQKLNGDWMSRKIEERSRIVGYHIGEKGSDEFFDLVFPGYSENKPEEETP